jgi:hypothetical protein
MKRLLALALFLTAVVPSGLARAQNSSPYVVGQWTLDDVLKDFKHGDPIPTDNSVFVFQNPVNLTLTLEYAFFASDGTFCGCDRDTLAPNGRTRYTMQAEMEGGQFSRKLCGTQTDGTLKSIVYVSTSSIGTDAAMQNGIQIHVSSDNNEEEERNRSVEQERTESDLNAVPVNPTTISEMNHIHSLCVGFIGN